MHELVTINTEDIAYFYHFLFFICRYIIQMLLERCWLHSFFSVTHDGVCHCVFIMIVCYKFAPIFTLFSNYVPSYKVGWSYEKPYVVPWVTLPSALTIRCTLGHFTFSSYHTLYLGSHYLLLLPYVVPWVTLPSALTIRCTLGHFTFCSYHTLYLGSLYLLLLP